MSDAVPRPLLSAIIINWNGHRWLPRLLDSLLPQLQAFPSETLLVDNASTDDSVEFVRSHYSAVTIVAGKENRGYAAGVNLGLTQARGDWLLVLNTDLAFPLGSVAALLAVAQGRSHLGLAGPLLVDDRGVTSYSYGFEVDERVMLARLLNLRQRHRNVPDIMMYPRAEGRAVQPVPYVVGACLLVRRAALDEVGPMDEEFFMYFEDADWSRRFRQAGWEVALLRAATVVHSGGGSSNSSAGAISSADAALPTSALPQADATSPASSSCQPTHWFYDSLDHYAHKHYGRLRALDLRAIAILTHAKSLVLYGAKRWLRLVHPNDPQYYNTQASNRMALRWLLSPYTIIPTRSSSAHRIVRRENTRKAS